MESLNAASIIISIAAAVGGGVLTAWGISKALAGKMERLQDTVKNQISESNKVNTVLTDTLKELSDSNKEVSKYLVETSSEHKQLIDKMDSTRGQISNELKITEGRIINELRK